MLSFLLGVIFVGIGLSETKRMVYPTGSIISFKSNININYPRTQVTVPAFSITNHKTKPTDENAIAFERDRNGILGMTKWYTYQWSKKKNAKFYSWSKRFDRGLKPKSQTPQALMLPYSARNGLVWVKTTKNPKWTLLPYGMRIEYRKKPKEIRFYGPFYPVLFGSGKLRAKDTKGYYTGPVVQVDKDPITKQRQYYGYVGGTSKKLFLLDIKICNDDVFVPEFGYPVTKYQLDRDDDAKVIEYMTKQAYTRGLTIFEREMGVERYNVFMFPLVLIGVFFVLCCFCAAVGGVCGFVFGYFATNKVNFVHNTTSNVTCKFN